MVIYAAGGVGAVAPGADDDGGRHRRRLWRARVARRIPRPWLRGGIVVTGLVMAGLFFWRHKQTTLKSGSSAYLASAGSYQI